MLLLFIKRQRSTAFQQKPAAYEICTYVCQSVSWMAPDCLSFAVTSPVTMAFIVVSAASLAAAAKNPPAWFREKAFREKAVDSPGLICTA